MVVKNSAQKTGMLKQVSILIKYLRENKNALRSRRMIEKIRTTLTLANIEIVKLNKTDPLYLQRIKEFNEAIIILTQGKWYTMLAMDRNSSECWNKAFNKFEEGRVYSQKLYANLKSDSKDILPLVHKNLESPDAEIDYAGDSPIIPEVNPIVILQGSDFDMGYQYAQQLVEIFGKWILKRKSGKTFTPSEHQILRKWEEQLEFHAPEILTMCRGWVAGAAAAGIPMSYEDVLDIWTGHNEPVASIMGLAEALPKTAAPLCSGMAAWGRATKDGKLVTGSSGDHDVSFMVTIMAYPETGNNFIYTPFGATGDVAKLGPMFMTGHPGMNSKGVAYVEHGGEPRYIEPRKHWGYGVRKGAAIFHILRFANSAKEACRMELSMPIGDVGTNFGSVGGFFADSRYGYILESRKEPLIIRESGDMGETDFLYVNNSAMHPDVKEADWLKSDKSNWEWDPHGGWHPSKFTMVKKFGGVSEIVKSVMRTGYENSFHRNIFLYEYLSAGVGKIDLEYIRDIYRQTGTLPKGEWSKISKEYNRTGQWGKITTGHASNALVTLMKPDNGNHGIYSLCVSSAVRGMAPMGPTFCTPIYGETNAFWELELSDNPFSAAAKAREKAIENINEAKALMNQIMPYNEYYRYLYGILDKAEKELSVAEAEPKRAGAVGAGKEIYACAKSVRYYTRCQVHARQVKQMADDLLLEIKFLTKST